MRCYNSCEACQKGVADPAYVVDPYAGYDDGSCLNLVEAGAYEDATNYNLLANTDDDRELDETGGGSDCPGDLDNDGTVATSDLLNFEFLRGTQPIRFTTYRKGPPAGGPCDGFSPEQPSVDLKLCEDCLLYDLRRAWRMHSFLSSTSNNRNINRYEAVFRSVPSVSFHWFGL